MGIFDVAAPWHLVFLDLIGVDALDESSRPSLAQIK
jgi:hypothetical protein